MTAAVCTLDEERNIAACLADIAWADEIIVADMGSRDRTVEIARGSGARILPIPRGRIVEEGGRQAVLRAARGEWLFFLDADERIPDRLRDRIRAFLDDPGSYAGAEIPRRNPFMGRPLLHVCGPDYQLRLLRREGAVWPERVHARPSLSGPILTFPAEVEDDHLIHLQNARLGEFLGRLRRYARLEVEALLRFAPGTRPGPLLRGVIVEVYWRLWVLRGVRDGWRGILYGLAYGGYRFAIWKGFSEARRRARAL
ncbi:MAG: glycosyltransferase family 2 protein [Planctomycetes bacterium]|nr:glycosyltransferase family 2 protein [Planctomycetota bacterium]